MSDKIFEITHDSLAAKIWEKVSKKERGLIDARNSITSAYNKYKDSNVLLSKKDIAYISQFLNEIKLNSDEEYFIKKSKRYYKRKNAIFFCSLILIFICLVAGIIYTNDSRKKAIEALQMFTNEKKRKEALEIEKLYNDASSFKKAGYDKNAEEKIKEIMSKNPSSEVVNKINHLKAIKSNAKDTINY